jgi:hypothetical protein
MKLLKLATIVASCILVSSVAFANADDKKWVAKCIADNADAKVSADVVVKYCTCMNEKMDDNETRSISAWEKANPKAMAECERASGWK